MTVGDHMVVCASCGATKSCDKYLAFSWSICDNMRRERWFIRIVCGVNMYVGRPHLEMRADMR